MATLETAIALAVAAHQGQRDKSGAPYILHPLRVMFRLETEEERIVAVLHDVLEDTPHTRASLEEKGFAPHLLDALELLTKREGERYDDFIARLAPNPLARRVKLADLEDNMDVRRLSSVQPKDAVRLEKYLRAHRALKAL